MNVTAINAQFTMGTEEVIRLKFENSLDDIVKHRLAKNLVSEIIESNLLSIHSIENKPNDSWLGHETIFKASLLVFKEK